MKKQTEDGVPVSVPGVRSSILSALAVGMVLAGTAHANTYLATGGDSTTNYTANGTNYAVHIFTSTNGGTFTPSRDLTVEYLVVAGGGAGGGNRAGGGGGAGAVHRGSVAVEKNTGYAVIVGAGGINTSNGQGADGGFSKFGSLPNVPGGGGGGQTGGLKDGRPGGCGGGGGFDSAGSTGGGTTAVSPQEGYAGGNGQNKSTATTLGGGGGGAGGRGLNWDEGGAGGPGITSSIRDGVTEVTYAEGGLRGVRLVSGGGTPAAEPANTGNGGDGGVTESTAWGGNGGSGIVIIRYALPPRGTVVLFR